MRSFLPAFPRTNEGATAECFPACTNFSAKNEWQREPRSFISRATILGFLALLLLAPMLRSAEAPPPVKLAVAPKYPALTLAGRVDGVVTVRVTIDRTGDVKTADVVKGHPMLRETALDAAQQWKFEESAAAKRTATLKFRFVILPDSSVVKSQTVFLPPTGIEIRQKPVEPSVEDQGGEFIVDQHPIFTT